MSEGNIRVLTVPEIVYESFSIFKRGFSSMVVTALLPFLIIYPLIAFAGWSLIRSHLVLGGVIVVLIFLLISIFMGALTHEASEVYLSRELSIGRSLSRSERRWKDIMLLNLMLLFIILGGGIFVLPGIILCIVFFLSVPLVIIERKSPLQALRCSKEYGSGNWKKITGVFAFQQLILLGALSVTKILDLYLEAAFHDVGIYMIISIFLQSIIYSVALTIAVILPVVTYHEVRNPRIMPLS